MKLGRLFETEEFNIISKTKYTQNGKILPSGFYDNIVNVHASPGSVLTSLKLDNMPEETSGTFCCSMNRLTSFEHGPKIVHGNYIANDMDTLTSLKDIHKHIHQIDGSLHLYGCPSIKSNILGVLLIKNLQEVCVDDGYEDSDENKMFNVFAIINSYLPNHVGKSAMIECQNALMDEGYEEYAKL